MIVFVCRAHLDMPRTIPTARAQTAPIVESKVLKLSLNSREIFFSTWLVAPGPEDGQEEDCTDGWCQIGSGGLDIVKKLGARIGRNDGYPQCGDQHQDHHEELSHDQQLGLARRLPI